MDEFPLQKNIDRLYQVFRQYRIKVPLSTVGVFDFGPTAGELEGISKPLREIPASVVLSMEFYGFGWESWGSEEEVKYFLPRLLEVISQDLSHLERLFSLIKYKMEGLFRSDSSWSKDEVQVLREYFSKLLVVNAANDIGYLIEALVVMGMPTSEIFENLNSLKNCVRGECAAMILLHFDIYDEVDTPNALHIWEYEEDLNKICSWAHGALV